MMLYRIEIINYLIIYVEFIKFLQGVDDEHQ